MLPCTVGTHIPAPTRLSVTRDQSSLITKVITWITNGGSQRWGPTMPKEFSLHIKCLGPNQVWGSSTVDQVLKYTK